MAVLYTRADARPTAEKYASFSGAPCPRCGSELIQHYLKDWSMEKNTVRKRTTGFWGDL